MGRHRKEDLKPEKQLLLQAGSYIEMMHLAYIKGLRLDPFAPSTENSGKAAALHSELFADKPNAPKRRTVTDIINEPYGQVERACRPRITSLLYAETGGKPIIEARWLLQRDEIAKLERQGSNSAIEVCYQKSRGWSDLIDGFTHRGIKEIPGPKRRNLLGALWLQLSLELAVSRQLGKTAELIVQRSRRAIRFCEISLKLMNLEYKDLLTKSGREDVDMFSARVHRFALTQCLMHAKQQEILGLYMKDEDARAVHTHNELKKICDEYEVLSEISWYAKIVPAIWHISLNYVELACRYGQAQQLEEAAILYQRAAPELARADSKIMFIYPERSFSQDAVFAAYVKWINKKGSARNADPLPQEGPKIQHRDFRIIGGRAVNTQ